MIEKTSSKQHQRWRAAVRQHCVYGTDNCCNGAPLRPDTEQKPPCRHYIGGRCTKIEIASCKAAIRAEISLRGK